MATTQTTFAGNAVLLDTTGAVDRWLSRHGPSELGEIFRMHRTTPRNQRMARFQTDWVDWLEVSAKPAPFPDWAELVWPTFAHRFAMALYLVDWPALRDIAGKCGMGTLPEDPADPWEYPTAGTTPETLLIVPEDDAPGLNPGDPTIPMPSLTATMYPLQPIRVDMTDEANLWIMPLVDRRFLDCSVIWKPTVTKDTTWDEFLDQWEAATGSTFDRDVLPPSTYTPAVEAFDARWLPANLSVDAAMLGAGYLVHFDAEGSFYYCESAEDMRSAASDAMVTPHPDGTREEPDIRWLDATPPLTIAVRPQQRYYASGRGGTSLIDPEGGTGALRVMRPPTTLMKSDNSTALIHSTWYAPIGHRLIWGGRFPTDWDAPRWDDFLRINTQRGYTLEARGLPREFHPVAIPLQVPGTVFVAQEKIRARLLATLGTGGFALAEVDQWSAAYGAWETTGLEVRVHEGLHHLEESIPTGTPVLAEHMGDGGFVVFAASCGC